MQYVRSISGSVSKTWNSINPATLSGAIDVIVIEQDDGSLACSPFHVRFGKFSLLRPYEKKVEFRVNDVKQDFPMKLGEGGEAFFVFETSSQVPEALQTSPLVSPTVTPNTRPSSSSSSALVQEPEPLDLNSGSVLDGSRPIPPRSSPMSLGDTAGRGGRPTIPSLMLSHSLPYEPVALDGQPSLARAASVGLGEVPGLSSTQSSPKLTGSSLDAFSDSSKRPASPPALPRDKAVHRAMTLSKKLLSSNIPSHVNDEGDLMLDMTGFKSSEEDALRAEHIARQILAEEVVGNYDIGGLIGADEKGNLWIYSSEEAKEMAAKRTAYNPIDPRALVSTDALSDPGYQSDDTRSQKSPDLGPRHDRQGSDSAIILNSAPESPVTPGNEQEPARNFAKTLRLTSDQLKTLNLQSGSNTMCFTVNRATCQANIYLWSNKTPIVVSDIDGTITKSDALGHVLNMIGRDWTHVGVAKLYTDIINNGYNIFYLTSRSVGQADTTRAYLSGIVQEGYKLPRGPVIMSPDRTIAALRREVYLRKPEVFKMACLRDIMGLFDSKRVRPFYAGFGNRLTDALSYRSVNIPSTRIFTINSNAEVSLDLLSLSKYKTAYTSMRETVDQYFPPVALLLEEGGDAYTDFNTWRDTPLEIDDISDSEDPMTEDEDMSGDEDEDDDDVFSDDLEQSSILGRESLEESIGNIRESIESDSRPGITRLGSESMTVPGRYRNAGRKQPVASKDDVSDEEEQDLEASVESLDLIAAAAGPQARYTLAEQQRRRGKASEQSLRRAGDELNAAARLRGSTR